MNVTLFPARNILKGVGVSLPQVISYIKEGQWKDYTDKVRAMTPEEYKEHKSKENRVPCITWQAEWPEGRPNKNEEKPSNPTGLFSVETDGKSELLDVPFRISYLSRSGTGRHYHFALENDCVLPPDLYYMVRNYLEAVTFKGTKLDHMVRHYNGQFYVSYDPDLQYAPQNYLPLAGIVLYADNMVDAVAFVKATGGSVEGNRFSSKYCHNGSDESALTLKLQDGKLDWHCWSGAANPDNNCPVPELGKSKKSSFDPAEYQQKFIETYAPRLRVVADILMVEHRNKWQPFYKGSRTYYVTSDMWQKLIPGITDYQMQGVNNQLNRILVNPSTYGVERMGSEVFDNWRSKMLIPVRELDSDGNYQGFNPISGKIESYKAEDYIRDRGNEGWIMPFIGKDGSLDMEKINAIETNANGTPLEAAKWFTDRFIDWLNMEGRSLAVGHDRKVLTVVGPDSGIGKSTFQDFYLAAAGKEGGKSLTLQEAQPSNDKMTPGATAMARGKLFINEFGKGSLTNNRLDLLTERNVTSREMYMGSQSVPAITTPTCIAAEMPEIPSDVQGVKERFPWLLEYVGFKDTLGDYEGIVNKLLETPDAQRVFVTRLFWAAQETANGRFVIPPKLSAKAEEWHADNKEDLILEIETALADNYDIGGEDDYEVSQDIIDTIKKDVEVPEKWFDQQKRKWGQILHKFNKNGYRSTRKGKAVRVGIKRKTVNPTVKAQLEQVISDS